MRWLVLTAAYPSPAEPERAIFIENLNRALLDATKGALEISVIAPRVHGSDPLVEERRGVTVYRFRYPSGGLRPKEWSKISLARLGAYFASGLCRSAVIAARGGWNLLLAHWILPAGVIAATVARMTDVPLFLYAHGSDVHRYADRLPGRMLCRQPLRDARGIFAVSRELAGILREEHEVDDERLHVLPMGVAPEFSPGSGEEPGDGTGTDEFFELLYIGDLTVEKGLEDLVSALEILSRNGVRARLNVVGHGPLAGRLAGLEHEKGRDPPVALRCLGRLSPERVARWCRSADLYVHPSHSEGAPLAVMEALSTGLPAVCTAVGGVSELVTEGATGLLVAPHDPAALAGAIRSLAEDRERLAAMRSRLLTDLPDYSVADRARRLLAALAEAGCVVG